MATHTSSWFGTDNKYIFFRIVVDESVSNGSRSVTVHIQGYKSSSATSTSSSRGTLSVTINGTSYSRSFVNQEDVFYPD